MIRNSKMKRMLGSKMVRIPQRAVIVGGVVVRIAC